MGLTRGTRAGAVAALAAGCVSYSGPASTPPPPAQTVPAVADAGRALVYVANQDDATISVVDAARFEVVATVDLQELGFSPTAKPHHVVVEPDGSYWYVSLIGANRVLKLDRANRVVGAAEFEVPGMLALDGRGGRLLVGRSMSAVNPPRRIGVIQRGDMSIEEVEVTYPRPHALALHPTEPVAYSASLAENRMGVVRLRTGDVAIRPIDPPDSSSAVHTVVQFAVSPDGRTLVGTGELSGRLLVFDLTDAGGPRLIHQVAVNARPWHPVFTPDGGEVWFANKGTNTVTVVETDGWTVDAVVEGAGLAEPHGAAVSADGRWVFVSSNDLKGTYPGEGGTLTVIDRADRTIHKVIPVGRNAAGVGTRGGR